METTTVIAMETDTERTIDTIIKTEMEEEIILVVTKKKKTGKSGLFYGIILPFIAHLPAEFLIFADQQSPAK